MTLVTDLPQSAPIDELPQIFDAAIDQWVAYFRVSPEKVNDWKLQAYLIGKRELFDSLDLMPSGHDQFPHGLSMGYEIWLHEQPSDYYRRHLLLHEATHSFMSTMLGGCGPGWYMEGMAEMLGTHEWNSTKGELMLGIMPANREMAPMWGRIKSVREALANNRALGIAAVMEIDNRQILKEDSYAWVWALSNWLDTHPDYRKRFRKLSDKVLNDDFNSLVREAYREDWNDLQLQWQLYISTLDYGYDIQREAMVTVPVRDMPANVDVELAVAASRGWQSTGYKVEVGRTYKIKSDGQFVIGREPDGTPWPCEANGVTLDYYGGRPLGILLAAIDPGTSLAARRKAFVEPIEVGLGKTFVAPTSGVLWLRVNDSPAKLAENEGSVRVRLARQ